MGELVPLKRVYFQGQHVRYANLPRNTLDLRWLACREHRLACDCREAELAEGLQEMSGELRHLGHVFDEVLKGHATWGRNDFDRCSCTGCQIARAAHMRLWSTEDDDRREALGEPVRSPMPWTDDEVPF